MDDWGMSGWKGKGGWWVVGLPLMIQQTCCIHFPIPIIITPFLPAITILFAINNSPGNNALVNNSAGINPLVNNRKMN